MNSGDYDVDGEYSPVTASFTYSMKRELTQIMDEKVPISSSSSNPLTTVEPGAPRKLKDGGAETEAEFQRQKNAFQSRMKRRRKQVYVQRLQTCFERVTAENIRLKKDYLFLNTKAEQVLNILDSIERAGPIRGVQPLSQSVFQHNIDPTSTSLHTMLNPGLLHYSYTNQQNLTVPAATSSYINEIQAQRQTLNNRLRTLAGQQMANAVQMVDFATPQSAALHPQVSAHNYPGFAASLNGLPYSSQTEAQQFQQQLQQQHQLGELFSVHHVESLLEPRQPVVPLVATSRIYPAASPPQFTSPLYQQVGLPTAPSRNISNYPNDLSSLFSASRQTTPTHVTARGVNSTPVQDGRPDEQGNKSNVDSS